MLSIPLRVENSLENFKVGLREWGKVNIAANPKSRFPDLDRAVKRPPEAPPAPPPPDERINLLRTHYFNDPSISTDGPCQ